MTVIYNLSSLKNIYNQIIQRNKPDPDIMNLRWSLK